MYTPDFHHRQAIGMRSAQQDAVGNLLVSAHYRLYVLADGMGGHRGGETASAAVLMTFLDYFEQNPQAADAAEHGLRQALAQANRRVAAEIAARPELSGMGTTLLAVLLDVRNGAFHFISVGDSPLYCWENGQIRRINANHAFAEDLKKMVAAGVMTAQEAAQHPARHAVTSAVTGGDIPHTDTGSGVLTQGMRLLLASDGIHTLSDKEIAAVLARRGASAEQGTAALLEAVAAKQRPHQDNTSVLLLHAPKTSVRPFRQPENPATLAQTPSATQTPPRRLLWPYCAAVVAVAVVLVWAIWPSAPEVSPVAPPLSGSLKPAAASAVPLSASAAVPSAASGASAPPAASSPSAAASQP